jgi:osmotically-inducible protein OsmY
MSSTFQPACEVQSQLNTPTQDTDRPSQSQRIERQARHIIANHPHFRVQDHAVEITHCDGGLVLTGYLPTFFFKQLLQEALRSLDGITRIDNRVEVAATNAVRRK